jgi:hypothetical protein
MRTDENVANGDPVLAALIREGVTVAHIVELLQTAYPKAWEQHLRNRLADTDPADLTPAELAKFTNHVFWLVKQAGIREPAAWLVFRAKTDAKAAPAAPAKLKCPVEISDVAAQQKSAEREPVTVVTSSATTSPASPPRPRTVACGTTKADVLSRAKAAVDPGPRVDPNVRRRIADVLQEQASLRPSFEIAVEATAAGQNSQQSSSEARSDGSAASADIAAMNASPPPQQPAVAMMLPANLTATSGSRGEDEVVIDSRRYVSRQRLASMLGISVRTLSRWRTQGKLPPEIEIGNKLYFELRDHPEA